MTTARSGQQTGIEDIELKDADQIQAVRAWWEADVAFNAAKARINYKKLEKTRDDAKEKAIEMLAVPGDGNKHRFIASTEDGWGTVVTVSGGGDPTPIPASTRRNNPRFRLEGTQPDTE